MELAQIMELMTTRWQQLLGGFAAAAFAAGVLGMLTRALGAKEGDGLRRLLRRGRPQA